MPGRPRAPAARCLPLTQPWSGDGEKEEGCSAAGKGLQGFREREGAKQHESKGPIGEKEGMASRRGRFGKLPLLKPIDGHSVAACVSKHLISQDSP